MCLPIGNNNNGDDVVDDHRIVYHRDDSREKKTFTDKSSSTFPHIIAYIVFNCPK